MSTTTEQNKAIIRRFIDAWNSRQPDAFDDLIAQDVVRHCEATPGSEARSLDQIKAFLQQDTAVFPDSVQTIKLLVAEGNLVAAWATYEGTQKGPMGSLPPSGPMVFTHFAWAIYSSKINILCRYCTTRNPLCGPPNEDSTRSILNECVPATVSSEMCEYRSALWADLRQEGLIHPDAPTPD